MIVDEFGGAEGDKSPLIEVVDTHLDRAAPCFKPICVFCFALFQQAQALTQHFARILIAAAADELLHDRGLALRQHDVAGVHDAIRSVDWHRMPINLWAVKCWPRKRLAIHVDMTRPNALA